MKLNGFFLVAVMAAVMAAMTVAGCSSGGTSGKAYRKTASGDADSPVTVKDIHGNTVEIPRSEVERVNGEDACGGCKQPLVCNDSKKVCERQD